MRQTLASIIGIVLISCWIGLALAAEPQPETRSRSLFHVMKEKFWDPSQSKAKSPSPSPATRHTHQSAATGQSATSAGQQAASTGVPDDVVYTTDGTPIPRSVLMETLSKQGVDPHIVEVQRRGGDPTASYIPPQGTLQTSAAAVGQPASPTPSATATQTPQVAARSAPVPSGEVSQSQMISTHSQPLHQRLSAARGSAFGDVRVRSTATVAAAAPTTAAPATTTSTPARQVPTVASTATVSRSVTTPPTTPIQVTPQPSVASQPVVATPKASSAGVVTPQVVASRPTPAPGSQTVDSPPSTPTTASSQSVVATRPSVASPPTVAPTKAPAAAETPSPALAKPSVAASDDEPTFSESYRQVATQPTKKTPTATIIGKKDEGVLFARQSPALSVQTLGPRQITVGKQSDYEIRIQNASSVAADQVVVTIDLPAWTDVVGAKASLGTTSTAASGDESRQVLWQVGQLAASGKETLTLYLIPRQRRPFDLAVKWHYTPPASQTLIEVQEPKIELTLEGPPEVLWGKHEIFKLHLINSGNGDAQNVEISLSPLGTGERTSATHRLPVLPAGSDKVVEVELTARQAGNLTIEVQATGEGGLTAHLSETIRVLRAALAVDVISPKVQFVGSKAMYQVVVKNTGTAPAQGVETIAKIPLGAKYVASDDGGEVGAAQSRVAWRLETLAPGVEKRYTVTCELASEGTARMEAIAAAGDLSAVDDATTKVEAIADLALNVTDPAGPVEVGVEAEYTVEVTNRGSKGAEQVEVVAYFSHGIEPVGVVGGGHKIAAGQVVFDQIPVIMPGESESFKVKALASQAGNHIFRAEVVCRPVGARLVTEETTYFFASTPEPTTPITGGPPQAPAATPEQPTPASSETHPPVTVADRRNVSVPATPQPATPEASPSPAPSVPGNTTPPIPSPPPVVTTPTLP